MKQQNNLYAIAGSVILTTVVPLTPVAAQEQQVSGDILVTAQRRSENIQDVPASVSAFDSATLRNLNVQNIGDVVQAIPNVIYQDNGLVARYNIRGITLNDTSEGNESPIGLYIDGTYFGFTGASKASIFDVARVEVLRGPQGTLYGRNTTGGLVSVISVEPTDELDGYASVQYGRFNQLIVEGAVGGPLSAAARVRISGKANVDDGFQENVEDGKRWGKTKEFSGRFQLSLGNKDQTELLLNLHGTASDGRNIGYGHFGLRNPANGTECSVELSRSGACESFAGFRDPSPHPTRVYSAMPPLRQNVDSYGGFVRFTHDFGSMTLVSQSAYENVSKFLTEDADSSPTFLAEGSTLLEGEQFTQELRLNGQSGNLDWLVGAFYYDDRREAGFFIEPGAFRTNTSVLATQAFSFFGDVQAKLSDTLKLSAGLRYTTDRKVHSGNFDDFFGFSGNLVQFRFENRYKKLTGRLVLSYQPNDDVLLYASASTGGKSPAFNTLIATADPDPNQAAPSDPEEITALEVGLKSDLFDKALRLNLAAFYYDYRGIQQTFSPPNSRTPKLANLGKARIYGAEAEAVLQPFQGLQIGAQIGFQSNKIESDFDTFDGNRLATTPEFSGRYFISYEADLGSSGFLNVGGSYRHQSKVFFAPDNDPYETQDAYGIADASIGWTTASGAFNVEAFGDNLFDERYAVHSFAFRGFGGVNNVVWGRPRTYGVRAKFSF